MVPQPDGKLRMVYLFPVGTGYDPAISFEPGEGGAGYSYAQNAVVYVPSIKYKHGIIVKPSSNDDAIHYGLKRRIYMPIAKEYEVYESILCLPITSVRANGTIGIMNIDSRRRDAFNIDDIHLLRAYARMLGDGIAVCS